MRLRSLATAREVTLAAVAVVLLGLTGSTNEAPAGVLAPLPAASAPATPKPAPHRRAVAARPAPERASVTPRVPVVDATPRREPAVDRGSIPDRLRSRDLDLDQRVRPVGVTADGDMELPDTVTEVGWYRFGALPGADRGTTVLAAHVDSRREGVGPFVRLRDAHDGDTISVVDRGGHEHRYEVVDVRTLAKPKIDWDQVFDRGGQPRLVLITCGGAYDQGSGYRDNVLVTAYPLS